MDNLEELEPDDTRPKRPISLSSFLGQYVSNKGVLRNKNGRLKDSLSYLPNDLSQLSFKGVIHLQEVLSQNGCRFLTPQEMVYIQNSNSPELRDYSFVGYVQDVGVFIRDLSSLSDLLGVNVQEVDVTLPFFAPISSFSLDNEILKYDSQKSIHWDLPPFKVSNRKYLHLHRKDEHELSNRQLYVIPFGDSISVEKYNPLQRGKYSTLCLNGEDLLRIFYDGTNFFSKNLFDSSPQGYNPVIVPRKFSLEAKISPLLPQL